MSFDLGTGNLGVAFVGDVGGLQRALGQAEGSVEQFGRKTQNQMRGTAAETGRLEGAVGRLGAGLKTAFVGGSVAAGLITLKSLTMDAVGAMAQAQVQVDRLRNGFSFGAGGMANGAKELAFVRTEVNRLGLELGGTASQYMKMVAASRGNKLAGDQTREIFKSIAEASVVMGMGVDQSERSFMAVTQMMSKGKVMAEELRGQLGEYLPGAFSIAARAMGITEIELNKLMETGGLMSDEFLPRFAAQLRKELAGSVAESTLSMQANLNRAATSWTNFKQQLAQGGVGGAISQQTQTLVTEIDIVGQRLEASRIQGDGFWTTMAKASGVVAGRVAFQVLGDVINLDNQAILALTNGVVGFKDGIDVMPNSLKPANVQLEILAEKSTNAQKELARLRELDAMPMNGDFFKKSIAEMTAYIAQLREAQREKRALMGYNDATFSVGSGDRALDRGNAEAARALAEQKKTWKANLDKFNFDHRSASEKFRDEVSKQKSALGDLYSPAIEAKIRESLIKPTKGAGQAAKAAKDEFSALMNQITAKDAGMAPDFYKDLNTLHQGYEKGRIGIDAYRDAVGNLVGQQQFAKDAASEADKAQKELGATMAAASALADKDAKVFGDAADALAKSNADLREETELIGLNEQQRRTLMIIKEREAIADKESLLIGMQNAGAAAGVISDLEREIALRRERMALMGARDSATDAAEAFKKQAEEVKSFWDSVDNTAHETFTSVANEGMDAFKRIGQTLKSAILDMLYQMTIKQWIFKISGQSSGSSGGGIGNSIMNAGVQYLTGSSVGASTASLIAGNAVGAVGGDALGTMIAANGGWAGVSAAGGTAATAATAGITTAAGAATTAIGSAASALGSMALAVAPFAAVALGAYALFGKTTKALGVMGTFDGSGNVTTSNYKTTGSILGGNSTSKSALDDNGAFAAKLKSLQTGAAGMADALGLGSDAVKSFAGDVKVNLKGLDSEEAAKKMAEEMVNMQARMLAAAEASKTATIATDALTEKYKDLIKGANAAIAEAGISVSGITDILAAGAIGTMDASEVGAALSESIIGGIYDTIAQNAFGPVAEQIMNSLITPVFTAIMAGVPISQALSQAAIDDIVASANRAAEAMNVLISLPEFQDAMSSLQGAFSSVASTIAGVSGSVVSYGNAAQEAANAELKIAQEKYGMETQLLTLLGNTTRLRERELSAIDESNKALQIQIWALEDAKTAVDSALSALSTAIDAQKEAINTQLDLLNETKANISSVFDLLNDSIRELRGEVTATASMSATAAVEYIRAAAASGVVPDSDALSTAVSSARAGVENAQYASRIERDRAYLTLANDLASLNAVAEPQLTATEQMIAVLEAQIDQLDLQLKTATDQVNALYGIDTSVKTVTAAVEALSATMANYTITVAKAAAITTAPSAPVASAPVASAPVYEAPAAAVWTASGYLAKNPDVAAVYNADVRNYRGRFGSIEGYASWHWANFGQKENRQYAYGGYTGHGSMWEEAGTVHKGEVVWSQADVRRGGGVENVEALRLGRIPSMQSGSDAETKALLREVLAEMRLSRGASEAGAVASIRLDKRISKVIREDTLMTGTPA